MEGWFRRDQWQRSQPESCHGQEQGHHRASLQFPYHQHLTKPVHRHPVGGRTLGGPAWSAVVSSRQGEREGAGVLGR